MFNKRLFKAQVVLKGKTLRAVAKELGIDEATLYRKMNGESDFFREEIQTICPFLCIILCFIKYPLNFHQSGRSFLGALPPGGFKSYLKKTLALKHKYRIT